jgi:predicted DNA-binding protein
MATLKNRLNISLSPELETALNLSAKRATVPRATKAAELLKLALEIEEDTMLDALATSRVAGKKGAYVDHAAAWK